MQIPMSFTFFSPSRMVFIHFNEHFMNVNVLFQSNFCFTHNFLVFSRNWMNYSLREFVAVSLFLGVDFVISFGEFFGLKKMETNRFYVKIVRSKTVFFVKEKLIVLCDIDPKENFMCELNSQFSLVLYNNWIIVCDWNCRMWIFLWKKMLETSANI